MYIRVDWPESQEFMTEEMFDRGVECGEESGTVFVPDDVYYELIPTKRTNLKLKRVRN